MTFEMQLKEKNLKVTPQRLAILNDIKKNGHTSIEEIYENTKRLHPSISLATIYKNIASLCEVNILREVKVPSHKQRYELACDGHIHVACEKCGKLEDVHLLFDEMMEKCSSATHYKLRNVSAVFMGVCKDCAKES